MIDRKVIPEPWGVTWEPKSISTAVRSRFPAAMSNGPREGLLVEKSTVGLSDTPPPQLAGTAHVMVIPLTVSTDPERSAVVAKTATVGTASVAAGMEMLCSVTGEDVNVVESTCTRESDVGSVRAMFSMVIGEFEKVDPVTMRKLKVVVPPDRTKGVDVKMHDEIVRLATERIGSVVDENLQDVTSTAPVKPVGNDSTKPECVTVFGLHRTVTEAATALVKVKAKFEVADVKMTENVLAETLLKDSEGPIGPVTSTSSAHVWEL